MSNRDQAIGEDIKSFLIVGENIDQLCSFTEIRRSNIFMGIVFLVATIYSIILAISIGIFWYYLAFSFAIGAVYYFLNSRVIMIYAITKFRIIRLERDILTALIFQRSNFLGFSDLHYEHVESISIGPPKVKIPQIYLSVFGISLGWLISSTLPALSLLPASENIFRLISIIIIMLSIVNLFFVLPIGGVRLIVQSISGSTMEFPEKNTPEKFTSQLLINCRTFLSYGAV